MPRKLKNCSQNVDQEDLFHLSHSHLHTTGSREAEDLDGFILHGVHSKSKAVEAPLAPTIRFRFRHFCITYREHQVLPQASQASTQSHQKSLIMKHTVVSFRHTILKILTNASVSILSATKFETVASK